MIEAAPIILHANYAEFTPQRTFSAPCVQSRMLLWCCGGSGSVMINGVCHPMTAGEFFFIPWGHRISYRTDQRSFELGGIHIVPVYKRGVPVVYRIPHGNDEAPIPHLAARSDAVLAGLAGLVVGSLQGAAAFQSLIDYIVRWYIRGKREEETARSMAGILLDELRIALAGQAPTPAPIEFRRVLEHIRDKLTEKLSIDELAAHAGCSRASLNRSFRKYTGTSPVDWIIEARMTRAAELLRTTSLPIGEIAEAVGVNDPYYFAKLFRRCHGQTAREYRKTRKIHWL